MLYLPSALSKVITRSLCAALVVDSHGVYDALFRSTSSCLALKDNKSGLEALALKRRLDECGKTTRWCHSAAQLGDVVTKDSDAARGIDTLDEPDDNEFADDVLRDPKSVTLIT